MEEKKPSIASYCAWGALALCVGVALPASFFGVVSLAGRIASGDFLAAVVSGAKSSKKPIDPYPNVPEIAPEGSRVITKNILKHIHASLPKRTALHVNSESFLVADIETGEVVIEKDKTKALPIASLSKLITALVALDVFKPADVVRIPEQATKIIGTKGGLKVGERVKVNDLLHALLMQSANDAAEALALAYGRSAFISRMNHKARFLGAEQTSFADPTGLSSRNKSTAEDLFKISRYIFNEEPELVDITRKKTYRIKKHLWVNSTKFLALPYYLGGKTGFTSEAGRTAVSVFELKPLPLQKRKIAVVLLKSSARDEDVLSILEYLNKGALLISQAQ